MGAIFSNTTQDIVNMLTSQSDGRNDNYSIYKFLFNTVAVFIDDIKNQAYNFINNSSVSHYGSIRPLTNVSVAIVPSLTDDTSITSMLINKGYINGYENDASPVKVSSGLNKILYESNPTIMEPILPNGTSYVGDLYSGPMEPILDISAFANDGIIGNELPVFIKIDTNNKTFYQDTDNSYKHVTIYIRGKGIMGNDISESIAIDYPGYYQTRYNYSEITIVKINHYVANFTIKITTQPPADTLWEPSRLYYKPNKKAYRYWYEIQDNLLLIKHYTASTLDEFIVDHESTDVEEYITILEPDEPHNPIATIDQIIPDKIHDLIYIKSGDYLYIVNKNKHLPGTLENKNILYDVFHKRSDAPLIKAHPTRTSYNSYDVEFYYYRDKDQAKITSYKIILHASDGNIYYYDPDTDSFTLTDQPEESLSFNSFDNHGAKGFYLKTLAVDNLPVGDNYIYINYLVNGNIEERYYTFLPVEYRIAQAKILISDENHQRPYGDYQYFAATYMDALLAYSIGSNGTTPPLGDVNDPYNPNHTIIHYNGCDSVVLPVVLTNNLYLTDAATGSIIMGGNVKTLTIDDHTYNAHRKKIFSYIDQIGAIWQFPRRDDEYVTSYAKRLSQVILGRVGGTKYLLERFLCNTYGEKQMRSFTITHPSHPNGIFVIENGLMSFYADGDAYMRHEETYTLDSYTFEDINAFLNKLEDDGFTVDIINSDLLYLSPAAIVNGSNIYNTPNERMTLGWQHRFNNLPVVPETVTVYKVNWMSNLYERGGIGNQDDIPIITMDETDLDSSKKTIFVDGNNNILRTNFSVDDLLHIFYYARDNDYAFVISPIFIVDSSDKNDRSIMMGSEYAPLTKYNDLFRGASIKNIKRWK